MQGVNASIMWRSATEGTVGERDEGTREATFSDANMCAVSTMLLHVSTMLLRVSTAFHFSFRRLMPIKEDESRVGLPSTASSRSSELESARFVTFGRFNDYLLRKVCVYRRIDNRS